MASPPSAKSIATEARLNGLVDRLGSGMRAMSAQGSPGNHDSDTDQGHCSGPPTASEHNALVDRVNRLKDRHNGTDADLGALVGRVNDLIAALTAAGIIS